VQEVHWWNWTQLSLPSSRIELHDSPLVAARFPDTSYVSLYKKINSISIYVCVSARSREVAAAFNFLAECTIPVLDLCCNAVIQNSTFVEEIDMKWAGPLHTVHRYECFVLVQEVWKSHGNGSRIGLHFIVFKVYRHGTALHVFYGFVMYPHIITNLFRFFEK
jgi:hypothetical protein